jgi:hypothetical protein
VSDPGQDPSPERRGGEPARDRPAAAGAGVRVPEPAGSRRYEPPDREHRTSDAKRFWAARRLPSLLCAAVLIGLSGLFLYDIVSVRADNQAMAWRKSFAHQLATRRLDDTWVILGASVCAAVGLWLLVLALTPGERAVLPMARRGPAGVRAGLDRHAAGLVLRDRAMEVPGVRWVKVHVGRRRIRAHAGSHFRELTEVRLDLDIAMAQAVQQLGLAKPPHLRVRVQRAEKNA